MKTPQKTTKIWVATHRELEGISRDTGLSMAEIISKGVECLQQEGKIVYKVKQKSRGGTNVGVNDRGVVKTSQKIKS